MLSSRKTFPPVMTMPQICLSEPWVFSPLVSCSLLKGWTAFNACPYLHPHSLLLSTNKIDLHWNSSVFGGEGWVLMRN